MPYTHGHLGFYSPLYVHGPDPFQEVAHILDYLSRHARLLQPAWEVTLGITCRCHGPLDLLLVGVLPDQLDGGVDTGDDFLPLLCGRALFDIPVRAVESFVEAGGAQVDGDGHGDEAVLIHTGRGDQDGETPRRHHGPGDVVAHLVDGHGGFLVHPDLSSGRQGLELVIPVQDTSGIVQRRCEVHFAHAVLVAQSEQELGPARVPGLVDTLARDVLVDAPPCSPVLDAGGAWLTPCDGLALGPRNLGNL